MTCNLTLVIECLKRPFCQKCHIGSHGLVVQESRGRGFESRRQIMDGNFYSVVKMIEKTENKQKEAWVGLLLTT